MGDVAVIYKINPDIEKKDELKKELLKLGAKEIKEEEVGFGIVSLKVVFVLEDKPKGIEEFEKELEKLEGISSINIEGTSLV